jgi:hypothetical protein
VPLTFGEDPERVLHLVLDTGAGETSVDPDAIERVFGKRVRVGKKINLRDGTAGPLQVRKLPSKVHEMDHLARALGYEIDGILGFPTFRDLLLTLDYPRSEVRIARGTLGPPDGVEIVKDYGKSRPYLALDIGGKRLPVLIDSGSAGGVRLRKDDPVEWEVPPRPVGGAVGYTGIDLVSAGRMRGDLRVGPLRVERPLVRLDDGTRLVGADILERFEATFDQKKRRIRLVPDSEEPIVLAPARGIGVALRPVAEGFEIARVFPGTPAEASGLRKGDLLVAFDGVPIDERGCRNPWDDADNRNTRLTVRRGGSDRDVDVEIAVLVP